MSNDPSVDVDADLAGQDKAQVSLGNQSSVQEFQRWLCYLIRRADRDITRRFLKQYGTEQAVPPVALSVLMLISATPGLEQREIAFRLGLDSANAARLIRDLDRFGWVTRRHPVGDLRKKGVYLTPQGVLELAKLRRSMRSFEAELASRFSKQEFATLLALLERLHQPVQR